MKINAVNGTNQPAFQKVNQKYLKEAENWYKRRGDIESVWYESLRDDVTLFKDISVQDGIDTMNAAKKYVKEKSMRAFNHVMDCIKRA